MVHLLGLAERIACPATCSNAVVWFVVLVTNAAGGFRVFVKKPTQNSEQFTCVRRVVVVQRGANILANHLMNFLGAVMNMHEVIPHDSSIELVRVFVFCKRVDFRARKRRHVFNIIQSDHLIPPKLTRN